MGVTATKVQILHYPPGYIINMDILHKVNLHIFVEFQNYYAHTFGENVYANETVYGKSIYDLTQADVEGCKGEHLFDLWICYRTAWIMGASKPDQGHGEACYYCHKACNSYAGNPSEWPVGLCHPDEPGKLKWHHTGCVSERLHKEK